MADISCEQGGDLQDYVWVFILARVLIGGGSACTNTIATTYLDDNTHNEDFGFLMGKLGRHEQDMSWYYVANSVLMANNNS